MKTKPQSLAFIAALLVSGLHAEFEIEPNDFRNQANPIIPGTVISGQISSESDQDWFGFMTTEPRTLVVTFDSPESSSIIYYHTVQVLNSRREILASVDTGEDTEFSVTLPSVGDFYVVILDGPPSTLSTRQYSLSLNIEDTTSIAEVEPNGSTKNATNLPESRTVLGQIASEADQDWFVFTVSGPTTASIQFDSPEDSTIINYHAVEVRNRKGTVYSKIETGKDVTYQVGLPSAGDYYLVVKDAPSSNDATKQYGVTLTTASPPAKSEVDSAIHMAIEITWNSNAGSSYVVEWTADMSTGDWLPVSSAMQGTGREMSYLSSIRNGTGGFFRVIEK